MAELTGPILTFPGGSTAVFTTPVPMRPGTRARCVDGSEYVFVDFTDSLYPEQPCLINADFTASVLSTGGRGSLGVVCAKVTSDKYGWAQIYGRCFLQVGTNAASPSDDANGPTTLSTSAQTVFFVNTTITSPVALGYSSGNVSTASGRYVAGITVASDASPSNEVSVVTSGTSHVGAHVAVFLNYPKIEQRNYGE